MLFDSFKEFFSTCEGLDQKAIRELRAALQSAALTEEAQQATRRGRSKTESFELEIDRYNLKGEPMEEGQVSKEEERGSSGNGV